MPDLMKWKEQASAVTTMAAPGAHASHSSAPRRGESSRLSVPGAHVWVLALLACTCIYAPPARAQQGGQTSSTPPLTGTGAPSGNCGVGSLYVNTSTGDLYDCNAGSWLKVNGGGGSGAFSGGLGTSYQDAGGISTPANPASGNGRLFFNSGSGLFSCITSSGSSCMPSGGAGTVTQVTSGNFSPLFNVSVATNTITPAFSFATINQSANTVYGNCTGSTGAPAFCGLTATMLPTLSITANGQTCTIGSTCNVNAGASAHSVALNQGNGNALTGPALGNAGQVFESNGPGADPSFQDPIVSYAYVNLWTTQDVTTTRTSATVRVSTFSQFGTLYLTWAGITGSPATCTVQIKSSDSVGNLINNGAAISVTPSNGTTSQAFAPAAGLQTSAQMAAVFACGTYPTAGTLTLDFVPQITVSIANTPNVNIQTNASVNVAQVNGNTTSTAATGVQKVGIVGNAGAAFDAAFGASPAANGTQPAALAATALPAAVSNAQDVQPMADKFGRQVVLPEAMRDLVKTTGGVQTTNATQTTLLAAQGAGVFADLSSLTITSESSTACTVSLTDGTNTYKINVANTQGSGITWNPAVPMPAASANTAWQVTGCASVTLDYFGEFILNK